MPLSTKDKLRLKLSAERVERWNRERMLPPSNDKPRCKHLMPGEAFRHEETIKPDRLEVLERLTDGHAMRSGQDKMSRMFVRRHMSFKDYQPDEYSDVPRQPVHLTNAPNCAKARPDSPFKRAAKAAAKVIVVKV